MIREREDIITDHEEPLVYSVDVKTLCRDEETCQQLNEFLDTGYGIPPNLGFTIQCTQEYVSATIDFTGVGARERAEITARVMNFIGNEVNKVKNGY